MVETITRAAPITVRAALDRLDAALAILDEASHSHRGEARDEVVAAAADVVRALTTTKPVTEARTERAVLALARITSGLRTLHRQTAQLRDHARSNPEAADLQRLLASLGALTDWATEAVTLLAVRR